MSKQAFKRVRRALGLEVNREPLPCYAWPGGYPLIYLCSDGEAVCPKCVNKHIGEVDDARRDRHSLNRVDWHVTSWQVFYEGDEEYCAHCNTIIESAYGPIET